MSKIFPATKDAIEKAATLLKDGAVVAFPTETVYGLGADATSEEAVLGIFAAKNRPAVNPLIVHVTDWKMAEDYAETNARAKLLAASFWPGPLSIILKRKKDTKLAQAVSAGLDSVALRAPAHPVAQQLIAALGRPIAAPSANRSGTLSPTSPLHVEKSLGDAVPMILAGGKCAIGLESTVVDMTTETPTVLRAGFILPESITAVLGEEVQTAYEYVADENTAAPHSPGQLLRHYAPDTPLRLKAVDITEGEALLAFGSTRFMSLRDTGHVPEQDIFNLSKTGDLTEAAANLFAMLHEIDQKGYKGIAVMDIPATGLGIAVNDRLRRAARAQQ
ncbi:MAG: threonylcarbamoyl-AMP synthase [Pseudomonadota bacterium]|nr:threonylcarbamoyl-AMP synthase [Pseudomonadota bacterium]QKK06250.1 MAG: threonylcarbamoyl-AMP synthase [Pseudomonadota bacterium]